MKPFDLVEYIANPSKQVITRDGRSVRILCTNRKSVWPIVALIDTKNSNENFESLACYYHDGTVDTKRSSDLDLFFNTKHIEG